MTNECRMVAVSAASLPPTAPRYLMGVGHQVSDHQFLYLQGATEPENWDQVTFLPESWP